MGLQISRDGERQNRNQTSYAASQKLVVVSRKVLAKATEEAIERIAEASYGKLLAYLSARSRDIQACEDALADSFRLASEKWTDAGVPENPEAWIITVAKNKLIDAGRKLKTAADSASTIALLEDERFESGRLDHEFKDERLKLLFVCCHPSIDESIRTPLMLQTVLGLESSDIASAFLISPAAMMKKLTRAKQKIKLAGIDFSIPSKDELSQRVEFVTDAVFAIYGKSWDAFGFDENRHRDLDGEAIYLAELLLSLLPNEPEAKGLLALMFFCESRKSARRVNGKYVPLAEQNLSLWSRDLIARAECLLQDAFAQGKMGRFQIEAAIQSAHCERVARGIDNWKEILGLYNALISFAPTVGAFVNRACAIAEHRNAEKGIEALSEIPPEIVQSYQPYWALRAALFGEMKNTTEALRAYGLAIGLSQDESVRSFLQKKKSAVR